MDVFNLQQMGKSDEEISQNVEEYASDEEESDDSEYRITFISIIR